MSGRYDDDPERLTRELVGSAWGREAMDTAERRRLAARSPHPRSWIRRCGAEPAPDEFAELDEESARAYGGRRA